MQFTLCVFLPHWECVMNGHLGIQKTMWYEGERWRDSRRRPHTEVGMKVKKEQVKVRNNQKKTKYAEQNYKWIYFFIIYSWPYIYYFVCTRVILVGVAYCPIGFSSTVGLPKQKRFWMWFLWTLRLFLRNRQI